MADDNNRPGLANLVSLGTRTTEEVREIARKGGVASGEARRRRKTLAEVLRDELDKPISAESTITKKEYIVASMVMNLKDTATPKALKTLAEIMGELVQHHEVEAKGSILFLPKEEIEGLKELAEK